MTGSAAAGYAGGDLVAEVVRSGFVESRHRGSMAVTDAAGVLVAGVGDVRGPIFPRSANKPMQAVGMLRAGLQLADPADLALVTASHWGEPVHLDRVRAMLASGGFTENDLRCPPAFPLSEQVRDEWLRGGGGAERIAMNCSGKHAGMLLTCRATNWPHDDYRPADHPVQRACRSAVEDLAGESVAAVGVDGCGAAVLAISLEGLARAFAAFVRAERGTPQRRVADAMRAFPELVSGTGSPSARLMHAVPGLLVKNGAEGVVAAAVPDVGAVAVKIDDGAMRATVPALVAGLRLLGVDDSALATLEMDPVLGGGVPVGVVRWSGRASSR